VANICVFCASSERIDRKYVDLASTAGAELARRRHTLVSGGGSVSCMGAVARAARAGGARTVGVIPRALIDLEVADHDADELVVTDDMRLRKGEMDRRSDAFLALPGGLGTLEELFEIWVARSLGMHVKPLVVLDADGLYVPLREQIDLLVARGFVRREATAAVLWTEDVVEAFDLIEAGVRHPEGPVPSREEVLESEP
jgi:uncharacterized protein (TIGR00730 family)